jgi:hypothetical protein
MDYADAVAALSDAIDAATLQAAENGLSHDEIISEMELKLMALKEEEE